MSILRVEQLEPRQLLSGGCFAPESSPGTSPDAGSAFPRVAERRSFVEIDHHRFDTPIRSQTVAEQHAGPQAPHVPVLRLWSDSDGLPRPGPAPIGGESAISDSPDNGPMGPDTAVAVRAPEGSELPRAAAIALPSAATPPPRLNLASGILFDVAGAAGLRLAVPAFVAVAPPVSMWGGRDDMAVAPAAVSPPSVRVAPDSAGDCEQWFSQPELPPPLSSVLSVLPPTDLSNLERGLRQFVAQLESTGQSLFRPAERSEFWPWIVAAAAALAACEIARRECGTDSRNPLMFRSDV